MGTRGRSPPGLQSCRQSGAGQDAGSAPPSPHTPVPPVVWDSGVGLDAEHLPTGALTPPRGKRPPFDVAVRIRPPPGERPAVPLSGAKQPPREPPPLLPEGPASAEEVRVRPPGLVTPTPGLPRPWSAAESAGWRALPTRAPVPPSRSMDLRPAPGLTGLPPPEGGFSRAQEERQPSLEAGTAQAKAPQQVLNAPGAAAPDLPAMHLSLGSIGHPHSCAQACRYVKRKGGCREGAKCPHCHLCFWRRDRELNQEREPVPPELVSTFECAGQAASAAGSSSEGVATLISVGTQGHPHSCAPACRYVRRKTGCRNAAACPNCHACLWTRELQSASGGVGQSTRPGLLRESTQTLEGLIRLFLSGQQEGAEAAGSEQGAGPAGGTSSADALASTDWEGQPPPYRPEPTPERQLVDSMGLGQAGPRAEVEPLARELPSSRHQDPAPRGRE